MKPIQLDPKSVLIGASVLGGVLYLTGMIHPQGNGNGNGGSKGPPLLRELMKHGSVVYVDNGSGQPVKTIRFTGVNVQIVNGLGATNGYWRDPSTTDERFTQTNGAGNLIIGYNEDSSDGSGSHNIVCGTENDYSGYGGMIAGQRNMTSGAYTSILGGTQNTASGDWAVVTTGQNNVATGAYAAIAGGGHPLPDFGNEANGDWASVAGGQDNVANGDWSTVAGGNHNEAVDLYSAVAGGYRNTALGIKSSVGGGQGNIASGIKSHVCGGQKNVADGDLSTVGGGFDRTISAANGGTPLTFDWLAGDLWQDF